MTRGGNAPGVVYKAIERGNARLAEREEAPLPEGITPHSLRRTFASVLYALGENPAVVMAEMGHTDPGLALRIYAQAMRRDDGEREQLRALVDGGSQGCYPVDPPAANRTDMTLVFQ